MELAKYFQSMYLGRNLLVINLGTNSDHNYGNRDQLFIDQTPLYYMYSTCTQCGRLISRPEAKYCSDECESKGR